MKAARTVVLFILTVFILDCAFAFASEVVSEKKMKITIGYCPFGMLETPVAKEMKFHKKYLPNVDVEWFYGLYSVHLINNWMAGKLEVAYLGDMPAIMLQSKQGGTKWVSCAVSAGGKVAAIFVPKDSPARTIRDLDGKTLAVGFGSVLHRILDHVMDAEGIRLQLVNQPPEVAIGNLEAGKIDAWCPWPPYISLAAHKGVGRALLPDCTKYEPRANSVWPLVVSEVFAEKHPDIVEGLVRADMDLHRFMEEHPREAAEIVYKELEEKIPLRVVEESLSTYGYSEKFDKEQIDTMQLAIDSLESKKFVEKGFKASDWADTSFVSKIKAGKQNGG
jgi:ABC-type nitrate/sulfonate/bicarbonate transport system substrate-binding protein